ncbi:MAG TPA: helix-turn-helix domain-containing protein [Blastocatellia bacterium]|nr:helix-turn-helix domain-containing protein [Blastocatellia bacterium]
MDPPPSLIRVRQLQSSRFSERRRTRLNLEAWMDIKDLHHQGHSIRTIADLTGHSRNTVRRVLRQKAPVAFHKPHRPSLLDEFKPYL